MKLRKKLKDHPSLTNTFILQKRKMRAEKKGDLPKVTQLISGRFWTGIQIPGLSSEDNPVHPQCKVLGGNRYFFPQR